MTEQQPSAGPLRPSATIDATAAASRPWLPYGRGLRRSALAADLAFDSEETALTVTDDDTRWRSTDIAAGR